MNEQPKTAEQINAPQTGAVYSTADEVRTKLTETFQQFKPALDQYYDYAQRAMALAETYHRLRLKEVLGLEASEEILVASLDARETPPTLDKILAALPSDKKIKRVVFDRLNGKYHLFA